MRTVFFDFEIALPFALSVLAGVLLGFTIGLWCGNELDTDEKRTERPSVVCEDREKCAANTNNLAELKYCVEGDTAALREGANDDAR